MEPAMLKHQSACAKCDDFDIQIARVRRQCRAAARRAGWNSRLANEIGQTEESEINELVARQLDDRVMDHPFQPTEMAHAKVASNRK